MTAGGMSGEHDPAVAPIEYPDIISLAREDPNRALDRVQELLSTVKRPSCARVELWSHLAFVRTQLQDLPGAARAAARAAHESHQVGHPIAHVHARHALSQVMLSLGLGELAIHELRAALALVPEHAEALTCRIRVNVANAYRQHGRLDQAAAIFDALFESEPHVSVDQRIIQRINAASTWWQVDRLQDANRVLDEATELLGQRGGDLLSAWTFAIRAWVDQASGSAACAREHAERAWRLAPDDLAIASSAARALFHQQATDRPEREADLQRVEALVRRASSTGRTAIARDLVDVLAIDARRREDFRAEAEHLRALRRLDDQLSTEADELVLASGEARAFILAARVESDALRAQRAALAEANARLADLARSRQRLIDALAHDLQSPLTALTLGFDLVDATGQESLVESLRFSVGELSSMIDGTLNRADLNHDATQGARQWVWMRLSLDKVVGAHRLAASQRGVEIVISCAPELRVEIEPVALHRIAHNIVANALKFTAPSSQVRVDAAVASDVVTLRVCDEGPGFQQVDVAALFVDRAQGASGRAQIGQGLGLHTVYRLTTGLGGTVHLEDLPEGGAQVVVRLPVRYRLQPASPAV